MSLLRSAFLHITKACNLRCVYCYYSAAEACADELTSHDYGLLWPELVSLAPEKVVFTGGEPLLRPDLLRLLSDLMRADEHHTILRCVNTNGCLITQQFAENCVGLVDEFRVSLDALADINDMLRGKGNFEAAVRGLDILYAAGFEPKVLITLTSVSLPHLSALLQFLADRHIVRVSVNLFRPVGRGANRTHLIPQQIDVQAAYEQAQQRFEQRDAHNMAQTDDGSGEISHCGAGRFLNVLSNGDVFPCHVLTDPAFRLGNIRQMSLGQICAGTSLLNVLSDLDFSAVAADPQIRAHLQVRGCLGEAYHETRSSAVWKTVLLSTAILPVNAITAARK